MEWRPTFHITYQVQPHSQLWFTPGCAAAICQRDQFFHQFWCNRSADNVDHYSRTPFITKAMDREIHSLYWDKNEQYTGRLNYMKCGFYVLATIASGFVHIVVLLMSLRIERYTFSYMYIF